MAEDDLTEKNRLTRRTWLFFDELKEAGNFSVLPRLLTTGRSKGVRIVVGFQDFNGLASVYGRELAHEIPGMCVSKAFFRIDEPDTAQWAARTLGESEFQEFTRSGSDASVSEHIVQRSIVLASELQNLPYPSPATPFLRGYYITPAVGAYQSQLPFLHPRPTNDPALNFWRRPDEEQHLPGMTDADFDRLGFRPPDAPPTSPVQAPPPPDEPEMLPRITRGR